MSKTHSDPASPRELEPPRHVALAPSDYQPSKAEMEEEIDMPEASLDEVRRAFFRPVAGRRR